MAKNKYDGYSKFDLKTALIKRDREVRENFMLIARLVLKINCSNFECKYCPFSDDRREICLCQIIAERYRTLWQEMVVEDVE